MTKKKETKKGISFILTDKEKELITLGAKIDNRSIADFVRNAALKFARALSVQDNTTKLSEVFSNLDKDVLLKTLNSGIPEFKDMERLMVETLKKGVNDV
jgi:uncharacterized protein (DUF1778 family)